jgi:hypothetical protein
LPDKAIRSRTVDSRRAHEDQREYSSMEIVCITVDCNDAASVAQFWNGALGWGGAAVHPDGTGAICGPPSGGSYLEFIRVPEGKVGKNRVHLGCSAGTLEQLDTELIRLQTLGASIAWEEDFPSEITAVYRNVILRDVEGNEFCLSGGSLPAGDLPLEAGGR